MLAGTQRRHRIGRVGSRRRADTDRIQVWRLDKTIPLPLDTAPEIDQPAHFGGGSLRAGPRGPIESRDLAPHLGEPLRLVPPDAPGPGDANAQRVAHVPPSGIISHRWGIHGSIFSTFSPDL